jgi:UDP-N-acetylglucosamine--N-acetylmuramyl-(pentapeptide) pyrophosphoryl-undecaprenol N-acetylglucosamine transferase
VHWLGTPRGIENDLVPGGVAAASDQCQRPARQGQAVAAQGAVHVAQAVLAGTAIIRQLKPVCVSALAVM